MPSADDLRLLMTFRLDDLTVDEREHYDERAGIAQFEGGLPRRDAEALALREVLDQREARAQDRRGA